MFALSTVLIAGGLAYTGSIAYKQIRNRRGRLRLWHRDRGTPNTIRRVAKAPQEQSASVRALTRANQTLTVSSLSLGLTAVGIVVKPVLVLVSVPAALFVFAPTLQDAWHTLRHERKITPHVLDATRVTLCIIMGYYFALALDTWLRALTQRLLSRTEDEFQYALDQYFVELPSSVWSFTAGAEMETSFAELAIGEVIAITAGELIPADGIIRYGLAWIDERFVTGNVEAVQKTTGDPVYASTSIESGQIYLEITSLSEQLDIGAVRDRLKKMTQSGNYLSVAGEQSGRSMAPAMGATFALLLPFWSANRAAGFLTTSFGSQMGRLGPYALRNFATVALQHNILIYDGRALERLNLVNTVIIEAAILSDETLREQTLDLLAALRRRRSPVQSVTPHPFAIYLLADGDELTTKTLAATFGFDDYFVEPLASARAELIERLQIGGRLVCYVGNGVNDSLIAEKALVTVAIPSATMPSASFSPLWGASATQSATARLRSTSAQVILIEKDLNRLVQLFALGTQFGLSQGFSLAWPLLMDLVDIGTTVFFHLGLTYSVLFSYSGLLGGALNTRLPLRQRQRPEAEEPLPPLGPERQIEVGITVPN